MDASRSRIEVTVGAADAGERIDRVLASRAPELSRTRLKALMLAGLVSGEDGPVAEPARKAVAGETLAIDLPPPEAAEPRPEPMALAILHEDADLVVVDKPAGLVVHPAPGNWTGTLVNGLIAHCGAGLSGIGGVRRPGIVHRLDKDTSGVLVVAKTDAAHRGLSEQFADHGRSGPLLREYRAFVWGAPGAARQTVDRPIGRDPRHRERMAVRPEGQGRFAVTHLAREAVFGAPPLAARVTCRLETGRTHQIRVHLAAIGHPLIGDPVYGTGFRSKAGRLSPAAQAAVEALGRQALHAAVLGFRHPVTGASLHFRSELPADLTRLQDALTVM